jgi:hypothetical protein
VSEERVPDCCCSPCIGDGESPSLRLQLWPPPDTPPWSLTAHRRCFDLARDTTVEPSSPVENGHVPASAKCTFCGRPLPIAGRHPLALDVQEGAGRERYWCHAACAEAKLRVPSFRYGPPRG